MTICRGSGLRREIRERGLVMANEEHKTHDRIFGEFLEPRNWRDIYQSDAEGYELCSECVEESEGYEDVEGYFSLRLETQDDPSLDGDFQGISL